MNLLEQLYQALTGTVSTNGHLPWCNHRCWVGGWNNRKRHTCDLPTCDGEGTPCIPRCVAVRSALTAARAAITPGGAAL